jgi:hypothetical protein
VSVKKHGKYIIVYRNQGALRAGLDIANEYKQDAAWATGNGLLVLRSDIAELANDVSGLRKQRDELLAACRVALGNLENASKHVDVYDLTPIRAAIANAEEKTTTT